MGGETIYHNCSFCADRFSVSAALLMHKMQCHSWDSNGKPASFDTFIDELITQETKHSSDANFNYIFNITTSVTQTAKECIVKAEPFMEITDNINFIKMDISEPIIQEQTFALPSTSLSDPTKTLCPLCGAEKSSKNMRRHMNLMHNTEIDPYFNASIRAKLRRGISQVCNEDEPFFDSNNINDPLIPVSFNETFTNAEYDEDTSSMDCQSFEPSPQECKTIRNQISNRPKEKVGNCPVCGKEMVARSVPRHLVAIHTVNILPTVEHIEDTTSMDCQSFESVSQEFNTKKKQNTNQYKSKEKIDSCPICGKEMVARSVSRHMKALHKTEIGPDFKAIRGRGRPRKEFSPISNKDEHLFDEIDPLIAINLMSSSDENPTNVEYVDDISTDCQSSESSSQEFAIRKKRPRDKIETCPVCDKKLSARSITRHLMAVHTVNIPESAIEELNAFQEMCPICQRVGYIRNLKRHLILVHEFTELQLRDVNLRSRFKCLKCFEVHPRSDIEVHFMEAHNIMSATKVRSLHVAAGLPKTNNPLHDPVTYYNIDFHNGTTFDQDLEPERSQPSKPTDKMDPIDLQPIKSIIGSESNARSITKCTMCDFKGTAHALNMHYKIMHAEPDKCNEPIALIYRKGKRGYNCTLCVYDATTRAAILQHLLCNHLETINQLTGINFDCDICPKFFSSFTDFEAHQNEHIFKLGLDKFFCEYCGIFKRSKSTLTQHMLAHLNLRNFICDICQKGFNKKHTLAFHMFSHSSETPYQCDVDGCGKEFTHRGKLREHTLLRHNATNKPHQCEICGKKFQLKKYLKLHSYIHGMPREYRCNLCLTILPSRQRLKSHRAKNCNNNCNEEMTA